MPLTVSDAVQRLAMNRASRELVPPLSDNPPRSVASRLV